MFEFVNGCSTVTGSKPENSRVCGILEKIRLQLDVFIDPFPKGVLGTFARGHIIE